MRRRINLTINDSQMDELLKAMRRFGFTSPTSCAMALVKAGLTAIAKRDQQPKQPTDYISELFAIFAQWETQADGDLSRLTNRRKGRRIR